jgi:chemotaxis signal transduction protein
MIIGVVVDVVSEVIAVPLSSVLPLPAEVTTQDTSAKTRSRYLKAMIRRPEGVAALLNIDRLFEAIAVS